MNYELEPGERVIYLLTPCRSMPLTTIINYIVDAVKDIVQRCSTADARCIYHKKAQTAGKYRTVGGMQRE